ncbi:MAG: hypothetical protein KOO60_01290 [Gemmatimonadales bacterium]|nr:hypothetical protein [Gemmatimonadales bacterium]
MLNLQGIGSKEYLVVPVTSAGPAGFLTGKKGASEPTDKADKNPNSWFRFDLFSSNHVQGGQANGPFLDELTYTPRELSKPDYRMRVSAGFLARLYPGWTLWQRTVMDSDPTLDPASRTKEFRQIDASVEVPDAALAYDRDELHAWIGRRWERWGPGWTGSLLLEPGAPTPDGFGYSWTSDRWAARYRCAQLDDVRIGDQYFPRYLAGHRLDIAVSPTLRISLAETALVTYGGSVPSWLLNPLLPWCLSQQEDRSPTGDTNIFWSLETIWNPSENWSVYGQFLLDDFMIDIEDRDTHPDQLGGLAGLLWSGTPPLSSASTKPGRTVWRVGLEYSRLESWTYVHRDPTVRYEAWSASLGHPAGPDSESLTLFCSRSASSQSGSDQTTPFGLIWARYHRQGQIWLGTPLSPVGSTGIPGPIPPVSRWWQVGSALKFNLLSGWTGTLRTGWTDTDPGIPSNGLEPNPSAVDAASGFWTSFTLTIPVLRIVSDL